jgi:hypothetical protein
LVLLQVARVVERRRGRRRDGSASPGRSTLKEPWFVNWGEDVLGMLTSPGENVFGVQVVLNAVAGPSTARSTASEGLLPWFVDHRDLCPVVGKTFWKFALTCVFCEARRGQTERTDWRARASGAHDKRSREATEHSGRLSGAAVTASPGVPHAPKPANNGNRFRERRKGSDQRPTSATRAPAHRSHRRRDRPTISRHPYFRTHLGAAPPPSQPVVSSARLL